MSCFLPTQLPCMARRLGLLLLFLVLTSPAWAQPRWYVTVDSSAVHNGASWASACSFQYALHHAVSGDEIWLKRGRYLLHNYGAYKNDSDIVPGIDPKRTSYSHDADLGLPSSKLSFTIPSGVKVYGSFLGTETALTQRPLPKQNPSVSGGIYERYDDGASILDGFLYYFGNSTIAPIGVNHTVVFDHVTPGTLLDGCLILNPAKESNDPHYVFTDGYAYGHGIFNNGSNGGSSTVAVNRCTFVAYFIIESQPGGAVWNLGTGGKATLQLTNCVLGDNQLRGGLAGSSNPLPLGSCLINGAAGEITLEGSDYYINYEAATGESNATLINCQIVSNQSDRGEGTEVATIATKGATAQTTFINCEFTGNGSLVRGSGNTKAVSSLVTAFGRYATNILVNCQVGINYYGIGTITRPVVSNLDGGQTSLSYCVFDNGGQTSFPDNPFLGSSQYPQYPILPDPVNPNHVVVKNGITNADLRNQGNTQAYQDAGGTSLDFYGNARIAESQIDIGISEQQPDCPTRLYVNAASANVQSGTNWETAFTDLQTALTYGCKTNLTEIWVAAGTYKPTSTTARDIAFTIPGGVKVYGGFSGYETDLSTRNWATNPTILSGNINDPSVTIDNAYHVVRFDHVNSATLLDGFVIRDGRASGPTGPFYHRGGGIYNDGSGNSGSSTPLIQNCSIVANETTGGGGGGFYNDGSNGGNASPTLINCMLAGNNIASGGVGAALYNNGLGGVASPRLLNCTLTGNQALVNSSAGGIYNEGTAAPVLTNCIVWGNSGTGSLSHGTSGGSPSVTYSILQGGEDAANHVLDTDPKFVSGAYSLSMGSPAINAGNTPAYTAAAGPTKDLAANLRLQYNLIDLGAYESAFSSDLTLLMHTLPTSLYGPSSFNVVVDVVEIGLVPTPGPLILKINKDAKVRLIFDSQVTQVGSRSVSNSVWRFSDTDPNYYVLTSSASIAGGQKLSVGLSGVLSPGGTTGRLTLSSVLVGTGSWEMRMTNNVDADKIEYFQQ